MDVTMTKVDFFLKGATMDSRYIECPNCGDEGVEETISWGNTTITTRHYRCGDRLEYSKECEALRFFFEDRALFIGQLVAEVSSRGTSQNLQDLVRSTIQDIDRTRQELKREFEQAKLRWEMANDEQNIKETLDRISKEDQLDTMSEILDDMEKRFRQRSAKGEEDFDWPDDLGEGEYGIQ